jgi:hypothetical protein
MSDTTGILNTLAERREQYAARFRMGMGNASSEIQRLIASIDHPASYYAKLSEVERDAVRMEWRAFAEQLDVQLPKAPKLRKPRRSRQPAVIPPFVAEFFGDTECLPHRPYVADNVILGTYPRSWSVAAYMSHIQLNPPVMRYWIIIDCDHTEIDRWRRVGLPEPAFITVNPTNHHHHVVYRLKEPVCTSGRGHEKPIAYLHAVSLAIRKALGGDEGYTGLLTKNPLHPAWQVVRSSEMPMYTLAELSKGLELPRDPVTKTEPFQHENRGLQEIGIGLRNASLFDAVRLWAYTHSSGLHSILAYGTQLNNQLCNPLPANEVRTLARSIAKYCTRHGLGKESRAYAAFCEKQAKRGRLGGRPPTTADSRPWVAEGISRATWYRRQKTAREKPSETDETKAIYQMAAAESAKDGVTAGTTEGENPSTRAWTIQRKPNHDRGTQRWGCHAAGAKPRELQREAGEEISLS